MADNDASSGFSEPIIRFEVPGFVDHRDELLASIDEWRTADPAPPRSNRGGWRSAPDRHRAGGPAWISLTERVVAITEMMVRGAGSLDPGRRLAMGGCWALVNEAGDWNMPHSHFGHAWSGVLHLAVPGATSEGEHDGGELVFIDPLGRRHGHPTTTVVAPVAGHAVAFPAHVVHLVAPHTAPEPRISAAFNLDVVDLATES